jgi:tetratricopeptide (TPR) repeat protein
VNPNPDRASELRLAGRWGEALAELEGRDDPDALVERVLILADENLLARDRTEELEAAMTDVERAAEARGDSRLTAFALAHRGLALHGDFLRDSSQGEPPGEMDFFERALALRRELGNKRDIAESLFHVGLVHQVVRGDHRRARPFFEESYDRARALGDDVLASYALRHIAFCDQDAGDFDAAERRHEEALDQRSRAGWVAGRAAQLLALAEIRAQRGRRDEARALAEEARATFTSLGADRLLAIVEAELVELGAAE